MKYLVFGEILWDVFEDTRQIGGAPFNFAAHAVKLGAGVDFVSAVGKDTLGSEALESCRRLDIPTDYIAVTEHPTGYCQVTLRDGTPEYDLVRGVAYDSIPAPEKLGNHYDVMYFGSLAQRGGASAKTLSELLQDVAASGKCSEVFFDINIRQNYYSDELIDRSLKASTILKVSREEIGVLGIPGTPEEICPKIMERYPGIKLIIVTLDSDGAFAFERTGTITYSPKPQANVISTVGAGDSFSAGFLTTYLKTKDIKLSLEKATVLAGFVCENTGAIPDYTDEVRRELGAFS